MGGIVSAVAENRVTASVSLQELHPQTPSTPPLLRSHSDQAWSQAEARQNLGQRFVQGLRQLNTKLALSTQRLSQPDPLVIDLEGDPLCKGVPLGLTRTEMESRISFCVHPWNPWERPVGVECSRPLGGDLLDEELSCSICRDSFVLGDDIVYLPQCAHEFHPDCLRPWIRIHNSCPLCRIVALPHSLAHAQQIPS